MPDLARLIVGTEDADAISAMVQKIYSYEKISAKQKPVEQPRGKTMDQLAKALGVSVQWLRDGSATTGNHNPAEPNVGLDDLNVTPNLTGEQKETKYSRDKVPIYGRAAGGRDGRFVLNGEKVGEILRPPSLEAVAEGYSVEQTGDSMSPAIKDGYKVYVNPKLPYRRGSLVVVQIRTGVENEFDGYAKEFVSFSRKELVLEQYNPPKQLRFDANLVESIHTIVGVEFI
ncbi:MULTISPECIES: S24 family peptidase [unclassified Bradyrhizobium]|uniref:S24 family peptidase n=1 Tax=Bradyrhizobium sp. USDA 4541 TaxID=2817704 RepID=UPI0020A2E818|nr:S24 family peptidase [Bradyrhizobium sp. USDA 4541]MCP1852856.1 phage repressor protein C with HTH and peptisase S24 domain [Bradyrhizobium sp. USDA 4541]